MHSASSAMTTAPPVPNATEWTPEQIADLRDRLGWTQSKFGQYLFDGYSAANAQSYTSRLESGDTNPGAAVRATLNRLAEQAKQDHS